MDMQGAIKELQETAIVMAGIQARQAKALAGRSDWLAEHQRNMTRIESNLAEATDKRNAPITIVDGVVRRSVELADYMHGEITLQLMPPVSSSETGKTRPVRSGPFDARRHG